jgi:hypothetical protein
METRINGSGPQWRPFDLNAKPTPPVAPARPAAETADPTVQLAAWFDRNGDGRIDTRTWVLGGDAFLPVDKDVSQMLDRDAVRPRDKLALANEAAARAYRKYGAGRAAQPRNS